MSKEEELGTLIIVVLKAKNLNDKHSFYKQDAYAQVILNGVTKKTPVDVKGGQHPLWDAEFRFSVKKSSGPKFRELEVSCWAKEHREDDLLGKGKVDITDTLRTGEFDDWVKLSTDEESRGEVYLEMTYYSAEPPPANAAPKPISASLSPQNTNLTRRPSKLSPADRLWRPQSHVPGKLHSKSPKGRDAALPPLPEAVPTNLQPGAGLNQQQQYPQTMLADTGNKPVPSILRPGGPGGPNQPPGHARHHSASLNNTYPQAASGRPSTSPPPSHGGYGYAAPASTQGRHPSTSPHREPVALPSQSSGYSPYGSPPQQQNYGNPSSYPPAVPPQAALSQWNASPSVDDSGSTLSFPVPAIQTTDYTPPPAAVNYSQPPQSTTPSNYTQAFPPSNYTQPSSSSYTQPPPQNYAPPPPSTYNQPPPASHTPYPPPHHEPTYPPPSNFQPSNFYGRDHPRHDPYASEPQLNVLPDPYLEARYSSPLPLPTGAAPAPALEPARGRQRHSTDQSNLPSLPPKEDDSRRSQAAQRAEEEAVRRKEEEMKRREKEAADRREEEAKRRREEEARKREEEARRREEEDARKRKEEEDAARRRDQEAAKRREQEATKRREQEKARREQDTAIRREQEAVLRREQEAARRREQEQRDEELARQLDRELNL